MAAAPSQALAHIPAPSIISFSTLFPLTPFHPFGGGRQLKGKNASHFKVRGKK